MRVKSATITPRETRVLRFITKFEEARGGTPTYSEIMEALDIKSKGHVSYILRSLRERGYVDIEYNAKRGIIVCAPTSTASHTSSGASKASLAGRAARGGTRKSATTASSTTSGHSPRKKGLQEPTTSQPSSCTETEQHSILRKGDAMLQERFADIEPTYAQLVECNRQYLLRVLEHHPECAHMVPGEMLLAPQPPAPKPTPEPVKPKVVYADLGTPDFQNSMHRKAAEIAHEHDITVDELIGGNRSPRYTPAREDFVVACRDLGKTFQQIGIYMNGRDWATIIHYERKAKARLQEAA